MSFVTSGYWSGYLSGIITGISVGWFLSLLRRDNFKEVCDFSQSLGTEVSQNYESLGTEVSQKYSSDDESVEMEVTEAVTVEREERDENTKEFPELRDLHSSLPEGSTHESALDGAVTSELNIIYFLLTDASLAKILENTHLADIRETSFSGRSTVVDTDDASCVVGDETLPSTLHSVRSNETNIEDDEMTGIFEEEDRIKNRSREETLDVGRKMPTRPVAFLTSVGGGYATMNQIETMGKAHTEYKEATLSRSDEMEIIHAFRGIIGQSYYDAQGMVKSQGYTLHPLYVGDSDVKRPAQFYSATTLGVRIRDENFDSGIPSVHAVITEIVDVGGIDRGNRGNHGNC